MTKSQSAASESDNSKNQNEKAEIFYTRPKDTSDEALWEMANAITDVIMGTSQKPDED